jgi:predicted MPP superfamily phosphohydrolase
MTSASEAVPATPVRRLSRVARFGLVVTAALLLLFGVPWWTLVYAADWPAGVTVVGTVIFLAGIVGFPYLMFRGHGRGVDWAARTADATLGVVWVLWTWSVLGIVLRFALALAGVENPARSRVVAVSALAVSVVLLVWGYWEAMRVPRVKRLDVVIPRLGAGLDGLKVVLITDTHYGPIDRARWSAGVTEVVNAQNADIVCHTGDIADGTPEQRRAMAAPLGDIRAALARTYITGNHEYYSGAEGWLAHMDALGWECMHNRHLVVERDGSRLVVAGVDDRTAAGSGLAGHRADHAAALAGADPSLPVLLLAHQPAQIGDAVSHGIDLQLSGHTHGGQIWPFHYLVRTDQPSVSGLSKHGERTQLYTSRGTGFWGPPFRVFAPSEITVLTLKAA